MASSGRWVSARKRPAFLMAPGEGRWGRSFGPPTRSRIRTAGLRGCFQRSSFSALGDGALQQDYLRAATAPPSARELYHRLSVPDDVRHAAHDIEADFHRGSGLGAIEAATRIFSTPPAMPATWVSSPSFGETGNFVARAHAILRTDIDTLEMAYPSTYLTGFYGLNCFLTLIIGQAWADRAGILNVAEVLRAGWRAKDGVKTGTSPSVYEVTLDREPGCPLPAPLPGAPQADVRRCHELIIRLGINPAAAKIPLGGVPTAPWPSRPRHLFPYHLPG